MTRDERLTRFREGLHPTYAPLYDSLAQALPTEWAPICGVRSFEDQAAKYAQGRTTPGSIITKAEPGLSYHQYGLASDWDYFPGGVYTPLPFEDPRWQEYLDACTKLALNLITWEKPHNELRFKGGVRALFDAHQTGGMDAVNALLKEE